MGGNRQIGRRRRRAAQRGQSLVEFSFVVIIFFLLIFGVIDFSRLFYTEMTLQRALRMAARFAVTGNHLQDPNNPSQTLTRVASIIQIAQQQALGINISGISVSSFQGGSGNAGGPGDTVTLSLSSQMQIITPIIAQFFPNGTYTFTVSTSFRNEPFPSTQTL